MVVYTSLREPLSLGPELGRGGEGVVYQVEDRPEILAKVYAPIPHAGYEQKLAWMKSNPPENPTHSQGHASLAWPLDLLYDSDGAFIGYTMPWVRDAAPILEVFNPRLRNLTYPSFNLKYLYRTARNLAAAVAALHARDYVIGDLNEGNILVTSTAMVTIIDTDSFQVREKRYERVVVYPCPVGKAEYTSPELQGRGLSTDLRRPVDDSFALAVILFQLLAEGNHPFRSRWLGQGDPPLIEEKIKQGLFPYINNNKKLVAPPPNIEDLHRLHPVLVDLFMRCFVDSIDDPELRPDPMEWVHGLEEAENALNRCNAGHEYSGHLRFCPLCTPLRKGPLALLMDIPYHTRKFLNKIVIPMGKDKSQAKKHPLRKQPQNFWDPVGVVVLVSIIIAVGMTMIVIPIWQQSVRNEAIRIVSTVPFVSGQHKTIPTVQAQNVGTAEAKANVDSGQEKDAEKTPDKSSDNARNAAKEDTPKAKPVAKAEEKTPKTKDVKDNKSGEEALPRSQPELQKDLKSQLDETNIKPVARRSVRWGNRISVGNMEHLSVLHTLLKDPRVSVTTMAFSPSGNLLVTGLSDNTIKIWRVKDGAHILTLRGHTGALSCVAFSPDGLLIASGSRDRTIRLWKAGNGELVSVLNGHQGTVTSLDFSTDGSLLASGSEDNNIRIWKVKSGLCINTLIGHKMDVNAVAFSPSGRLIASGSRDNTVKLWRIDDGTLISSIAAHHWDITSIAFSPGGNVLASASMDDSIRFWRIKDSMQVQKLMGHFKGVTSIGFSPNGELLTSGSDDGTVKLWRVNDGTMLRTIGESAHPVKCVAYSPNGSTIAAGLDNGLIYIWGLP
ncbi:MAG TPA: hypothetical protein VHR47_12350 [Bacillota bacterium]|nr:hypothetical protein [Bacillota bacterium]